MCGRFTLYTDIDGIFERYEIEHALQFVFHPSYNIAPTQQVVSIIHDGKKNRAGLLRWGLIPSWANDPSIGLKMINARAETLLEKPAFKKLVASRRCVIPANGFYEWKKTGTKKQPMYIGLREEPIISLAGLYDTWVDESGNKISTCTIITTHPNSLMADIHNRMPVILDRKKEKLWLDRNNQNIAELVSLLEPFPADKMIAYPVSSEVGNAKKNHPDLIKVANID